jgi:hypothetical protein
MDSIDPQAQDSPISNGVAEPATLSVPASPPQALTSALSDTSRTAEQGKDGERTSFRFPLVASAVLLRTSHQVLLHHIQRLPVLAPLPKNLARSTSTRNSWKRIVPHPEQARYPPLRRLQRSRAQRVSPQVCMSGKPCLYQRMLQPSLPRPQPPHTLASSLPSSRSCHRPLRAPAPGGPVRRQPRHLLRPHPYPALCLLLLPHSHPPLSLMVHRSFHMAAK